MKTKRFLPLVFVTALLTACKGDYIECSSISVNNASPYTKSEETITLVARYELAEYSTSNFIYTESSSNGNTRFFVYFYYSYSISSYGSKPPILSFPKNGTFNDNNQGKSINMTLVSSTNKYSSYTRVFYSQKTRTIKIDETYYKKVSAPNDEKIQNKTAFYVSIYETMESLNYSSRDYYLDYRTVTTKVTTTYVDVGDNVVTYTPLTK